MQMYFNKIGLKYIRERNAAATMNHFGILFEYNFHRPVKYRTLFTIIM